MMHSELIASLRHYLEHPDDIAALFYLGTDAALIGLADEDCPVTPRAAVDLAMVEIRDDDLTERQARAADDLINALWPDSGDGR